jgi:RNA polymerase sporulation-specific sigma factor
MGKVVISGIDTSKLRVLTEKEKKALLSRVKEGDNAAREELILGNLRLVLSVIRKFNTNEEMANDFFQVGCMGLIKAIDNFNLELDVRFSTYAVAMIIGEIRRYRRDNNSVRVSRSIRDLAYRALKVKEEIMRKDGREASLCEIARVLKESEKNVGEAIEAICEPVSLYDSVYNDGEDSVSIMDKLSDDGDTGDSWVESISLRDALKRLGEREKNIINRRFYKGKTQMEIAEEIGISQAQVSRLEKSALDKLRKYMQ